MKSKKTTSSRLRHRLALESEQETADGAGGYARTWTHVAYLWAEIIPMQGKERLFADKIQAESTHRIRMRYRSDITTRHRLVFESRVFATRAIRNIDEKDELLEIMAEEGTHNE